MKGLLTIILIILQISVFAQSNLTEKAEPIVAEGKILYKSEMASWYGTDLFLENYKNQENIGGYFSYIDGEKATCIFYSKTEKPLVIGYVTFDSTYNIKTANVNLKERQFTKLENEYYLLRTAADIHVSNDTTIKSYKNTSLNFIPVINGNENKVYILTATTKSNIVYFGNDYLLKFDKDYKFISNKKLHQNLIPNEYGAAIKETDGEVVGAVHMHLPNTGDYITATDICTLMLYEQIAKWKTYTVVSKNYVNLWNCETNTLVVITTATLDKISEDTKKRNKKKN